MKHKLQKPLSKFSPKMLLVVLVPLVAIGVYSLLFGKAATVCTTTLSPGANIVSAINSASGGSVICLNDGNYSGFRADAASTNKSSYVTLQSVNDKKAVITGDVTFDNARNIRLQGLKLNSGAKFVPSGNNIDLIGNESTYTLYFFGDYRAPSGGGATGCPCTITNVTIKDNYIHDVHYEDPNDTRGQFGENGITGLHVSNFNLSGNTIKSVSGDYIQSSGIDNWTVDSNKFLGPSLRDTNPLEHQDIWQIFGCDYGCYGENNTTPDYHDNIVFTNNLAQNAGADTGLLFQTAYFRNPRIENNLFDAADRGGGYSVQIYNSENLIFRSNTIINSPSGVIFRKGYDQTGTKAGLPGKGYQVDHNIFGIEGTLTGYNVPMSTEGDVITWGTFDYNVGYNEKTPSYGFVNKSSVSLWTPSWTDTTCYQPKNLTLNDGSIPGYKSSSVCGASSASSLPGDVNGDNSVNISDISALLSAYGQTGANLPADLDKNSTVNIQDLSIILTNYGKTGTSTVTCTGAQHTPGGPDGMGGCWPGPSNTGVPVGTTLTAYTGPCTITASNTVIDKKTVNCNLLIKASNVTITNSQVNGAIILDSNDCGTTYSYNVADSTIHTDDINLRGLLYCKYTATRVDVSGGQSMAWCDTCTIQNSYLHSPLEDPAGAAANQAAHNSTVRMTKYATIKHNTLWCAVKEYPQPNGQDTSGCSANQTGYSHDGNPPYNSTLEANLYMPTTGGFCAYGGSTTGDLASVHDIVFKDNVFKRGTNPSDHGLFVCGYYGTISSFDSTRPGNQWINNKYDDGTLVPPAN